MSSEILNQEYLQGERITKKEMQDGIVEIEDFVSLPSKFEGNFVIIQAKINDDSAPSSYRIVTFIGSGFMLKQLRAVMKENFPLRVHVVKKGDYWRLQHD
jgi:hypothetical protein